MYRILINKNILVIRIGYTFRSIKQKNEFLR